MKNRFVISENDRRSILSMYNLINEDENKTRIVGTIQVVPTYFRAQNIELSLYGNNQDDSYEPIDGLDIEDMVLLGKTKTNNNGNYVFNNVTDFDNLFISFEGNDFYDSINYRVVKLTPNKDNTVDFDIKSKNGKKPDDEEKKKKPKKIKKCEKKESDNNKFYGYGEYMIDGDTEEIIKGEPFKKNVQGKMYQEASKVAVKDALFDYLDLYPNKVVSFDTLYKHILNIIGTQDLKKLTITCKKVFYENGKIVATTIVKFKKTFLDQEIKKLEPKIIPVVRKIDFEDIDFQKALEDSFKNKKKIFLFFCTDNQECNGLLKNFVELGDLDKKLGGWIKLYYKVDMSQEKKYVVASETLKVFTYPTVVILEASKDPTKNYIKDSVRIIKKITSFDETISGMSNLLN
jgi:hypothetical protein